jgi:hypothetical protein
VRKEKRFAALIAGLILGLGRGLFFSFFWILLLLLLLLLAAVIVSLFSFARVLLTWRRARRALSSWIRRRGKGTVALHRDLWAIQHRAPGRFSFFFFSFVYVSFVCTYQWH